MAWTPELQAEYNARRARGQSDLNIAEEYGVNPADVAAQFGGGYVPTNSVTGQPIAPAPQPMGPAVMPTPATQPTPTTGLMAAHNKTLTQAELDQLIANRYQGFEGQWGINPQGMTYEDLNGNIHTENPTAALPMGNGQVGLFEIQPQADGTYKLVSGGIQGTPQQVEQQIRTIDAQQNASMNRNMALSAAIAGGAYAYGSGMFGGTSGFAGDVSGYMGLGDTTADIFAQELINAGIPFDQAINMGTALANANVPLQGFNAANYAATSGGMMTPPVVPPGTTPPVVAPPGTVPPPAGGPPTVLPPPGGTSIPIPTNITDIAKIGLPIVATTIAGNEQNKTNRDIANQNNDLIRQQNENAKFRPVGVTTRFGQSQFGYDANGRLTQAGYALDPGVKMLQDRQIGMVGGLQGDWERAVQLGRGAMKTPEQYMQEQLGLLSPTREQGLAAIRNQAQQTGRMGLATGGTSTTMATNPEMAAYYNAIQQENARLAANAPTQSLALANQGLGLMSAGYAPLETAIGGITGLEKLGQQTMDLGTSLGAQQSTANARLQTPQVPNQVNPFTSAINTGVGLFNQYQQRQPVATTQNPYVPQQPYQPYVEQYNPQNPYAGGTEQWTGNSPFAWD